jgi:hypothetical protein
MPDRAGVKVSWFQFARLILKCLPSIPRFYLNRPSVADRRVSDVCVIPIIECIVPSSTRFDHTVHCED